MSYTSALVEALADKLLQREDKLKKLTNLQPNIDLVEALSDDAPDDKHIERATIKARQHWQTMEGSTPFKKSARTVKASQHRGHSRRATYTAIIGIGQHKSIIERKNYLIGDAKAKQFLEDERRKRRYGSTNNVEDVCDGDDDENKTEELSETGVFKSEESCDVLVQGSSTSQHPKFPLRLNSAPEPVVLSHASSLFCRTVGMQETKKGLQKMATELNHLSSFNQEPNCSNSSTSKALLNRSSPTTQQNGPTNQNGDILDKTTLMDEAEIETKSETSDTIEKSSLNSLTPLLASDDVPVQTSATLEDATKDPDSTEMVEKQPSSPVLLPKELLSRKTEYDVAIEASKSARAKLAELGAK
jgi:hypothetical protein